MSLVDSDDITYVRHDFISLGMNNAMLVVSSIHSFSYLDCKKVEIRELISQRPEKKS